MPTQQQSRITRRAVIVALLAATAATGAVFLIKQDARGASAAAAGGGTDAIIGGEDAPNDQFPWMVSLNYKDQGKSEDIADPAGHFCGGSLIRPDVVLTAAHCCEDVKDNMTAIEAVIGAYDNSLPDAGGTVGWEPERRDVASITIHPDYDDDTVFNDLCIVKLATPSSLPLVQLALSTPAMGTSLTNIGWGNTIPQLPPQYSSYSYSYSYSYEVCQDVPCPDGSKAKCCDIDGSCEDGDDDYCCGMDYLCSNDGAAYAASMGGELCCDVEATTMGPSMATDEKPINWGLEGYVCKTKNAECNYVEGVSSSASCWDACKNGYEDALVAIDYRPSDGLCCCETECPCLDDTDDGPWEVIADSRWEHAYCDYYPAVLQIVHGLFVKEPEECMLPYNPGHDICAGAPKKRDNCDGDSGGPLLEKNGGENGGGYKQVGIVSRGAGCAFYPGLYADVSAYRDWIDKEAGPSCEDDESWHKADEPDKDCAWVAGKPQTRCAVKGPGWGQDKLLASYACPSVCGGPCDDSGSWTKTGAEDWKGCAWVSIFPSARCKVWGEEPGEEGRVLAATACPDSCAYEPTDVDDEHTWAVWGDIGMNACKSSSNRDCNYIDGVSSSPECWGYCRNGTAKSVAVEYRPSDGLCCCETECPCLADADGPFELTTAGSILELDECPGDESADDIPMNAADE